MPGTGLTTLAFSQGANSFPVLQARRASALTAPSAGFFPPSHTHTQGSRKHPAAMRLAQRWAKATVPEARHQGHRRAQGCCGWNHHSCFHRGLMGTQHCISFRCTK